MGYGNDPNATFISTLDKVIQDATTDVDNMAKKADELGGGITGVGLACLEAHPIISTLIGGAVLGKGVIVAGEFALACKNLSGAIGVVGSICSSTTGLVVGLTAAATAAALAFAKLIENMGGYNKLSPEAKAKINQDQLDAVGNFGTSVQVTPQDLGFPTHATGTNYFSGGLTEVGEHGGEILNLPNGTQIIPNDISKKATGGYTINCPVTVQGNVIGNEDFVNYIGQAISSRVSLAISNC